ncbi:MAG: serine/threonine-protein kinase, partial [Polyangiaceae bacterium]
MPQTVRIDPGGPASAGAGGAPGQAGTDLDAQRPVRVEPRDTPGAGAPPGETLRGPAPGAEAVALGIQQTVRVDPGDETPREARGRAAPGDHHTKQRVASHLDTARPGSRARRCPSCEQHFSGEARFCPFDGDVLVAAPDYLPDSDPLLGQVLEGRYHIESVLGEGGMGTVYEARHVSLDRRFALKVLRRDVARDAELTARFIQEAKAAAAVGHPNIVAVSDFGEIAAGTLSSAQQRAVPYFVMEYLSGRSLAKVLGEMRTLDAARVGAIIAQAASALAAAHAAGIVHRDLKPDNVFLVRDGERDFVKLLDFGVAKIAGAGRLTRAGMVYGTPHYMSPEQASGNVVDHRSDIYALGIIMYECFAGRVPFEADTYMGVLTKHMFATPEPIERVVTDPGCLGSLAPIVMRCLEKRADDRFANMNEVAQAIQRALEGQGSPPSARRLPGRSSDRLRLREPEPDPPPPRRATTAGAPRAVAQAPVWPYGLAAFVVVLLAGIGVGRLVAPTSQEHPAAADANAAPP